MEKYFFIDKESKVLIISNLSLKNIFNLSNGIYEDEFEEIIIKQLLSGKKIIVIKEGLEYLAYSNITANLLEKYNTYIKNMQDYGIKIQNKSYFLKQILSKEEIYSEKLLDLKKIKDLSLDEGQTIIISENTIVTSSAMDFMREKNIMVVKRR